ncbi:hypothetical protein PR202_gb29442 [Eleusine coracana subsp. coracana]|uniref:Retrotransposon gag domain-containing protein n=1 Tax=Eleusine coracana subsp. coracana TaxID=191504 RepID=A0AAV5FX97_ELECO|nr:hypothetical protein PR202_gb29442 [Eleusine coracana subsp. coracana]
MDAIIEERDQALQDAESFEHDMIEAQDDLDAFKAAHLPIEGNWDEITLEYGEQEDVEMAPAGNDDVEMMDPQEPEELKDIDQDMVHTQNQNNPESSQQGANAEPSLAEVLAAALNRQQNDSELLCRLVDITLLECTEHQKVLFTAQQLSGPAGAWWANYTASVPAGHRVEWNEFRTTFQAHFIPAGLVQRKFQEFMDLKQGGRNVLQYSESFNHLAQYATDYVNTEEMKRYAFMCGMNATLKGHLTWQTTSTYNDLVNATIVQEGAMRQVEEEDRKRKAAASASAAPQAKHRLIYT